MAIFIALIFQVLFVAFAMAINIGLVVHDKINLQNAVDFAAFYAAQRQAEMLNVIAHQNYQIRQAYKLMAWRYRVVGSSGLQNHPLKDPQFPTEQPFLEQPSVCITRNSLLVEVPGVDDVCSVEKKVIPPIFVPPPIAGFDPINAIFMFAVIRANKDIKEKCEGYGAINFAYAATSMMSFRQETKQRKQVILALARNLAKPLDQMVDLDGNPVALGATKTFRKNLTYENHNNQVSIEFFNSMEGKDPREWLREIPIKVEMYYTDSNGQCSNDKFPMNRAPNPNQTISPQMISEFLEGTKPATPGSLDMYSIGYEKNPWYLIYSGVKAATQPRQVFWPFGGRVQFEASAFAQPFGGRIGPWYRVSWKPNTPDSSGDRLEPIGPVLASDPTPPFSEVNLPNHARFPGDQLGLNSRAAHASFPNLNNFQTAFRFFANSFDFGPNKTNDALSFDEMNPGGGVMRRYEIAAVAPDLFDITYYSIDPNFMGVGLNLTASSNGTRLRASKQAMGIPDDVEVLGDHGSREGASDVSLQFNVMDQIKTPTQGVITQSPAAAWFVRDRENLLVDWVHNDSFEIADFNNPINLTRFARCEEFDDGKQVRAPGACMGKGGRTGYSVKIVSKKYLSGEIPLGAKSDGAAPIMSNSPPADW
jgi:hypothetical protein